MAETANTKICALFNPRKMLMVLIWITYFVFLFIVVCFAIRTFFPQKTRVPKSFNISIVDVKGHGRRLSDEVESNVKEQLHTALIEVSRKAEAAYNEKFATLLEILTLFGVAWPLVITYLQNMSLKEDRDDIRNALKKAELTDQKNQATMAEIQHQKIEIKKLQIEGFIHFAFIQFKYAADIGPVFEHQNIDGSNGERICYIETTENVTSVFHELIDILDTFYQAELIALSIKTDEYELPQFIKDASVKINNLAHNYRNINYKEAIPALDQSISKIEKLNLELSDIKQSLQYLDMAKNQIKKDYLAQTANN